MKLHKNLRGLLLAWMLFNSISNISAENISDIDKAVNEGSFKQAIILQKEALQRANEADRGKLLKDLALLYLKDQDQEAAFATFINSLKESKIEKIPVETIEGEALYKDALSIYLVGNSENPQLNAKKLIEEYSQKMKEQKNPSPLGYLVAAAYANLCHYDEFFEFFYVTYQRFPEHFLAYKTKAILHIKLMERRRTDPERNEQREIVLQNLDKALALEPRDTSLYKMLITFSFPDRRKNQVQQYLNKILESNIIISRSELQFYVQESVDVKEYVLAQRFIDRAGQWYPKSRIVNAMQNYLNAQKER